MKIQTTEFSATELQTELKVWNDEHPNTDGIYPKVNDGHVIGTLDAGYSWDGLTTDTSDWKIINDSYAVKIPNYSVSIEVNFKSGYYCTITLTSSFLRDTDEWWREVFDQQSPESAFDEPVSITIHDNDIPLDSDGEWMKFVEAEL